MGSFVAILFQLQEDTMLPIERLDYSAIKDRPRLALPANARLVVWVIINVEEWNPRETMPRTVLPPPAGGSPEPDIPNWHGTNTATASAFGGCWRSSTGLV